MLLVVRADGDEEDGAIEMSQILNPKSPPSAATLSVAIPPASPRPWRIRAAARPEHVARLLFNLSLTPPRPPLALNLATIVWILLYSIFGPILYGRMMTKSR